MKNEGIKLLMGMMPMDEALESTKNGVYPMVIDGVDPSILYGDLDPSKIIGKESLASYNLSENGKRMVFLGTPIDNVTHIVTSNGTELSVIKTTPSARLDEETLEPIIGIDETTGKEMLEMDSIYTLADGRAFSLMECIEQIEEMNPIGASKS